MGLTDSTLPPVVVSTLAVIVDCLTCKLLLFLVSLTISRFLINKSMATLSDAKRTKIMRLLDLSENPMGLSAAELDTIRCSQIRCFLGTTVMGGVGHQPAESPGMIHKVFITRLLVDYIGMVILFYRIMLRCIDQANSQSDNGPKSITSHAPHSISPPGSYPVHWPDVTPHNDSDDMASDYDAEYADDPDLDATSELDDEYDDDDDTDAILGPVPLLINGSRSISNYYRLPNREFAIVMEYFPLSAVRVTRTPLPDGTTRLNVEAPTHHAPNFSFLALQNRNRETGIPFVMAGLMREGAMMALVNYYLGPPPRNVVIEVSDVSGVPLGWHDERKVMFYVAEVEVPFLGIVLPEYYPVEEEEDDPTLKELKKLYGKKRWTEVL
ncbi:hypothetical protein QBC39DRAFT_372424 [Podospora conica]|nr:hypothetical protein QBC39DRAFT_372424 [Schizothecium conicum]